MKVVFVSRYGSKNLGDELIVRELENLISKYSYEISRFNFSLNYYNSLSEAFNYSTENFSVEKTKSKYSYYRKYIRNNELISIFRNYFNKKRASKNTNFIKYSDHITKADVLVIGGGNAIFDTEKHSSSWYYFGLLLDEARKLGKPIFVINVGIGPFQTQKQLEQTNKVLNKADYITVRDRKSFELVSKLNEEREVVYQTIDPVVFLDCKKKEKNKAQTIGINIMDIRLADYSEETYVNYIHSMKHLIFYYLTNTMYEISVFCTEKLDIIALNDLRMQVGDCDNRINYVKFMDVKSTLKFYENIDVLVGTRMHSNIIALSQNIPFIGIGWQQKVFGFFESIKSNDKVVSLEEFNKEYTNVSIKLDQILDVYPRNIDELKIKKNELHELFKLNEEILKNMHFKS